MGQGRDTATGSLPSIMKAGQAGTEPEGRQTWPGRPAPLTSSPPSQPATKHTYLQENDHAGAPHGKFPIRRN